MPVFRQLGDPVAGAATCLCQHHGATYTEVGGQTMDSSHAARYDSIADSTTIVQTQITTTKRCCIVVNAAMMCPVAYSDLHFEIERPIGTPRTTQRNSVFTNAYKLMHHAAWEVLPPGIYTYYLVNHAGAAQNINATWIKAVASDCEG